MKNLMNKTNYYLLLVGIMIFFLSCSDGQERKNVYDIADMPAIPLKGELIEDELLTPYTIQMQFIQSQLFHFTPVHEEVCLVTTAEVDTIGFLSTVGSGPGELNQWPDFCGTSVNEDTVFLHDNMIHKVHSYLVEVSPDKLTYTHLGSEPTKENKNETPEGYLSQTTFNLRRLDNGYYIGLRVLTTGTMFTLFDPNLNEVKKFGEYPIDKGLSDGKLHNTIYFQGTLHTKGNSFYYGAHNFGYLARYDVSDMGKITKVWDDFYTDVKCRFDNRSNELKFAGENLQAFYSLAISDKYLYAAYSGIKANEMFKQQSAYAHNPKHIVVFDLQGKPLAKFLTEGRMSTICLDPKGEYLYVKHIDPDISLWRYKISDILKHL